MFGDRDPGPLDGVSNSRLADRLYFDSGRSSVGFVIYSTTANDPERTLTFELRHHETDPSTSPN